MLDNIASSVSYRTDGSQSVFPIPFPFLESSHIRAWAQAPDGTSRALRAGSDFTVNMISDGYGEFILLDDDIEAGSRLTVSRLVPLTQEILFHNQGPNSPRAIEATADKLTMIAQQLDGRVDNCLFAPEGFSADEISLDLADAAGKIGDMRRRLDELSAALERKLEPGDRRLDGTLRPASHAASHFLAGGDRIRPQDIGSLPAPPSDGKTYLAVGGGWVEYIPPSVGGGDGGDGDAVGTLDHSRLLNRSAADQHPQEAIQGLPDALEAVRRSIAALADAGAALPGGGSPGDWLRLDSEGAAAWSAAEPLPLMSASQKGVASLAVDAGLELDASGALGIRANNLIDRLALEERLASLSTKISSLGAMSKVADAPSDGKMYARCNGGWVECGQSGASSGGGAIVGEIRLLPFRMAYLPKGWYACNGDQFPLSSAQGDALNSLPAALKSDWGISVSSGNINLPNLFAGADGYFLRAVNNSSRMPGNKQSDAMRNITAHFGLGSTAGICWHTASAGTSTVSGAFYSTATKNQAPSTYNFGVSTVGDLNFDASRVVPTAGEFRPKNVGMTPAIYLGV